MQAEFSVELGSEDAALEIPWSSPDGTFRFLDLRRHPELVLQIREAAANPELKEFLAAINARSRFYTAKCDVWFSPEVNPDEEIFGACKFGSYVDLVLASAREKFSDLSHSFDEHSRLLQDIVKELGREPDLAASAEFILRRCYFHQESGISEGCYATLYVLGFGEDEQQARRSWSEALKTVQSVLAR